MNELKQKATPEWNEPIAESLLPAPPPVPDPEPVPGPAEPVALVVPPPASAPVAVAPVAAGVAASVPDAPPPKPQPVQFFAGPGVRFKGELFSCDELHLSGTFEGAAAARKLVVAAGGLFSGDCMVEEAEIDGIAGGNLTVTGMLTVRAGGVVKGRICYGEIALERGAHIEGELLKHVPGAAVAPPKPAPVSEVHAPVPEPDPVLVELSAADIVEEPAPVAPPPRVLTAAEPEHRRRFGLFGGRR
jgi:cytoskeletal protein CcmA (bactofilin family)